MYKSMAGSPMRSPPHAWALLSMEVRNYRKQDAVRCGSGYLGVDVQGLCEGFFMCIRDV